MSDTTHAGGRSTTPVVTLFESYGSGASYIGPRVAQALGLPYHPQAFSSEEIEDAMTKRESEGVLSQVFGAMGGAYAGLEGPAVAMAQQDNYALHVVLDGPLQPRIERAAKESGIDVERATKRQKREDEVRADMSIEFYGWDPRETTRYDLMVNTGTMDLDTCVDIIVQAAKAKAGRHSATST
jgi:hypothetical protein